VHAADVADREGALEVLHTVPERYRRRELIWMDQGDRGEALRQWLTAHVLRQEMVLNPSRWGRWPEGVEPPPLPAFTVLPHRWIVERTFAWLGRYRRLSKDYEQLPMSSCSMLYAALLNTLLRRSIRLTQNQPSRRRARCRS
jgi:putative transposase